MKKSTKIFAVIAAAVILAAALGSAAVSALAYRGISEVRQAVEQSAKDAETSNTELKDFVSESIDEMRSAFSQEDVAQENDVCIAQEYWIRDTSAISEAYKSGDTSALDDKQKETLKMASDLIDEIITDGMTDEEKEEAVYVWLTTKLKGETGMLTVVPTSSAESGEPFGVLKYRTAVCVGYATTFRLLMHMMDIDCMVVHDTSLSHSWDLVKLDGEWYHLDCYFDTGATYRHFNLNDAAMSNDHEWNTAFFPKAAGVKYNRMVRESVALDDIYALPEFVAGKLKAGEEGFSCSFGDLKEEDHPAAMYMITRVAELINMTYDDMSFEYYWTQNSEGGLVLCMFCRKYESDIPEDLDEKSIEKVEDSLEKAFGDIYFESDGYSSGGGFGEIGG
ncbi:MAG: hypothetical protein IKG85_10105 [Clostridia bacterium]|nr:hypothetical protein [Clostridia bacterium]